MCAASFGFTFDAGAEELTITDSSFLADGDAIVSPNGVQITVQDATVPTANSIAGQGDGTAAVVISTATLDPSTGSYRIDYAITTDEGCTSNAVLFFNPNTVTAGNTDPYADIR